MRKLSKASDRVRFEQALSVSLDIESLSLETLRGLPAVVGLAQSQWGQVHYAASSSGGKGSERELLSVFIAPEKTFR